MRLTDNEVRRTSGRPYEPSRCRKTYSGGWGRVGRRRCRRHRKEEKAKETVRTGEGREKKREKTYSWLCCRKWVKRQVERAANLNHRQFCAIWFNEIVLKAPNAISIFTFSVFRLPALSDLTCAAIHARHELDVIPDCSNNESTFGVPSHYPTRANSARIRGDDGICLRVKSNALAKIPSRLVRMLVFTFSNIFYIISITGAACPSSRKCNCDTCAHKCRPVYA